MIFTNSNEKCYLKTVQVVLTMRLKSNNYLPDTTTSAILTIRVKSMKSQNICENNQQQNNKTWQTHPSAPVHRNTRWM